MADVNISKYRASVVREGSKPATPGFVVSEGQDPVNPPGTNNFVPYSGATSNVELGEFGLETGFINLDTTPTGTPTTQGTIFWDADDETVDVILNGYTMKIGEDLFYPVKNQTGSTIAKGVAVRFAGTLGASGRLLIEPFIANGTVPSSRFMGVTAEEILNGEDGKVLYFGRVRGINTDAFNEGDILYASTTVAGGYQTAIPLPPNNIVQVAAVISKSATVGTIFVRPTLGSNINTDEGVKITSVADKNLLQYQSGTSLWENKTLAQVLGGTSSQFVKGDGSLDSTSYQPLLTNPVTGTGTTNYLPKFTGSTTIGNSNLINDTSGNLGLGVTPSAWSIGRGLDINGGMALLSLSNASFVLNNAYYNGGWIYKASSFAQNFLLNNDGSFQFNIAPSGTAGNAISFTQAMTLFSTGNLLVGSGSDTGERLQVSGNIKTNSGYIQIVNATNPSLYINNTSVQWQYYLKSNYNLAFSDAVRDVLTLGYNGSPSFFQGCNLLVGTTSDNGARLQVSGTSTFGGRLLVSHSTSGNYGAVIYNTSATGEGLVVRGGSTSSHSAFVVQPYDGSVSLFNVLSTGAATFSSSVTASGSHGAGSFNAFIIKNTLNSAGSGKISWQGNANNETWAIAQNQTVGTGFLEFNYLGSNMLVINPSGNVLIGTTTDNGARLQVRGAGTTSATNAFSVSNNTPSELFYIRNDNFINTGTIGAAPYNNGTTGRTMVIESSGGLGYLVSTRESKSNIETIKNVDFINQLNPVQFNYRKKNNETNTFTDELYENLNYGFIADEVEKVNKDLVFYNENLELAGVEYNSIIAILTKAIQELKQEIDTLKN